MILMVYAGVFLLPMACITWLYIWHIFLQGNQGEV